MPERAERLRQEAWRWHRLARENLLLAEAAVAPDLPRRGACFWIQQAAQALEALVGREPS